SLANDVELKKILYVTLKDVLKTDIENNFLSNIFNDINEYKLARECNASFQPRYVDKKTFSKILNDFENKLYFYKKLDFSNMIYMCEKLLRSYKSILKEYQDKFKYILVDEFQDINKSQYDIVKLICKTKNLFVVGDDDQSIYSFRGSCPGIMKTFLKDYRFAKKICLNINYRSTDNIVRYSKNVIDCNKDRLKKDLVANNKSIGNIFIKGFVDSRDENKYIINKIIEYKNAGISLDDIAILYRTNLMAKVLQQDLIKNNISYRIKEDNEIEFYEKDKNDKALSNKSILESVSLMTFHLSKGLEFKIVFIIDANDGIVPHKKSIKSNDIETERRLFYVAMTRAKYNLHIYFTIRRFGKNYKASRFILEAIGGKYGKERKNFNS
ncbi:MAG: ATP-dependent helicase, partial [Lachnospiraceae bacterium]|nr:ATP-dependent helicase [Lachnospiraceae bacterium]